MGEMKEDERKTRRRRRRYNRRSLALLGLVLLTAAVLVGGIEWILHKAVEARDDGTILQGVRIGDTDVSGMTKQEALAAVEASLADYSDETVVFELETGDQVTATLQELGLEAADAEGAVEQAERYGKSGGVSAYKVIRQAERGQLDHRVELRLQVLEKNVKTILQERSVQMLSLPVNAALTVQNDAVTIIPEQDGEAPDAEEAAARLEQILNAEWDGKGISLQVSVTAYDPEITAEDLAELTDVLGTHTTYYGADGSGRSQNVESGAGHIDGILVQPGEEVSANALMEPYTYENGYTEAASYESNTVVNTMGGGICQVSTTLYNALLYAELEIVERYPHSMLVSYAEPSKDAAIAEDLLDLVFKNNLETPVYLEAALADGNLTFRIYGKETRSAGRTLEFVSETTESKETEGKRFVATEDEIGYYQWQSDSHPEISAQLWKVVYENGEEISRDIINYSTYMAAPATYGVGTASDDPAMTEKMNQAILTQDETTILNTMNEILAS